MGCEEHIRHGNQPRQYVVLQNMSGIIFIKKLGLLFIYIEACGADLFVLDPLRKGLRVDQAAARYIDKVLIITTPFFICEIVSAFIICCVWLVRGQ